MIHTISPDALGKLLEGDKSLDLIDVRTPAEYRAVHVARARLTPLDSLTPDQVRASRPTDAAGPTYILCKSGQRARSAAKRLAAGGGGGEAVVVDGGTDACVAAGLVVERGRQAVSIERQVRIAAGSLVAAGTLLGLLVSPWFLVVPAIVGCGLVFAGISNTCGMGMLLARMPWNR